MSIVDDRTFATLTRTLSDEAQHIVDMSDVGGIEKPNVYHEMEVDSERFNALFSSILGGVGKENIYKEIADRAVKDSNKLDIKSRTFPHLDSYHEQLITKPRGVTVKNIYNIDSKAVQVGDSNTQTLVERVAESGGEETKGMLKRLLAVKKSRVIELISVVIMLCSFILSVMQFKA